ncbi:eukaryotic translation initiation factor 5B [Umbelopsis nana]
MGKKKGGNRKKDDYWDEEFAEDAAAIGASTVINNKEGEGEGEGLQNFSTNTADFGVLANVDEEEGDSLMALMSKAAKKKGKKNKKAADVEEDLEDEPAPAAAETAEPEDEYDWAEKPKHKKGKKDVDAGSQASDSRSATPLPDDNNDGGEIRILSKKEKEKLKKEKAKEAKKKAAANKKAAQKADEEELDKALGLEQQDKPAAETTKAEPATETAADGDEEQEGGDSKNKKKKKKKGAKKAEPEEEVPAEAAAAPAKGKKKGGAPIAALRKMMEAQRAAEEEARRLEEEARLRAEEEERIAAEEERKKEEAKQKKKEKEKAKKEQLRKEGKLLTKAQKEAQQHAQRRLQQMIDAGIKVEGLMNKEGDNKVKRPVYDNRKKKKGPQSQEEIARKEEEMKRLEEEKKRKEEEEAKKKAAEEEEVEESWENAADSDEDKKEEDAKDSWDQESEEDVKDSWDASSDEEEEKPKTPAKTATAPAKGTPKEQPKAAPKVEAKPAVEESESEEESDEDSSEEDSSDYSDSDEDSSDEELTATQKQALKKKEEAAARRMQRHNQALAARSKDDLRSPIACILGHVDTGKTKLLDKIRQTNVQEGEAGGITQQIGATYFPGDAIKQKTAVLGDKAIGEDLKLPGLLVIDTPGHESFTNLRSRGSSLCNIAILVVDIMHGLEPQTLESIRLLRDRKTPFIVALNKIDRLFGWKAIPDNGFQDSLAQQTEHVKREFESRVEKTILAFAEQGLNACLYYDNKNFAKYVSLVPTSAHSGEGVPDMLNLLVNLTQTRMSDKLMYITELECTVLEVKVIEGLGTTIDVVLVNGWLREGDKIVVCGLNGPIVTQVRALLTPQPMRELRIKSAYVHHKEVKAALGIKIAAPDLEKAIAGSRLLVCGPDDDEDDLKEEVMSDLTNLMSSIDRTGHGVWVQASTLGSLEALLEFLKVSKIPVSGINIGPVHKKDVHRASVMLEKAREFAVMLCFDVKVDKEAEDLANELGIKVFKAEIIYHLFDAFTAYHQQLMEQKRKDQAPQAVFPCVLKMVPQAIFNKKDPIIIGVDVIEGVLRIGTPLCVIKTDPETKQREIITLGKVTSMEQNHKAVETVKRGGAGGGVAIKIECAVYETPKTFGRHFTETDELYSKITRQSIDILKESFRADLSKEDWALVVKLKKVLGVD